jgi:hypothetical protein
MEHQKLWIRWRRITDLGSQFNSQKFQDYCNRLGTQICYASIAHPKSNNQVERANAEVLQGLQTTTFNSLEGCGKNWVDQVPLVVWSLWTTAMRSTGETPFSLVYGAKAVLPMDLKYGSPWISSYDDH